MIQLLVTAGGRITCPRCQANSKRIKVQCSGPAMRGKRVCKYHGGLSTGPRTELGRQICAAARTVHGKETRAKRRQSSSISKSIRAAKGMLQILEVGGEIPAEMISALLRVE